jgi:transposase InsO family protein
LFAADRRRISCWGFSKITVSFGGSHHSWRFLKAKVRFPIIGIDFLSSKHLLVDPVAQQLVPAQPPATVTAVAAMTGGSQHLQSSSSSLHSGPPAAQTAEWKELLEKFPEVTAAAWRSGQPTHHVQHVIETSGRPVNAKFRRLDPSRLAAAKAEFKRMLDAGIVRRSSSSWSSPLHLVKKKDGSWRPCGDFRKLNVITKPDCYPLPNMADCSARLDGCTWFTKIDLQKGYLQVPVAAADVPKTAVITPFGLYEFLRMPFGLRNAGMTFQRMMDNIFADVPFVFVYLDDLLVASRNAAEHRQHVSHVLHLLKCNGLLINADKCIWGVREVEFLGHVVSAAGIRPVPARIAAIQAHPPPANIKQLQGFLGLFNFYRRFVRDAAGIIKPLTDALKGGKSGTAAVEWSPPLQAAFKAAKCALANLCHLEHPAAAAELSIATDASATHIGGVLQQRRPGGHWRPLGFFSAKLDSAQQRYSAFDRELLAVFFTIRHFRCMLEGRRFTIFTDHRPLIGALGRVSEPWTARQQRHLSYISEFSSDIQHVAGEANTVADTLSRPAQPAATVAAATAAATPPPVDLHQLADAQRSCPDCQKGRESPALRTLEVQLPGTAGGPSILVDTSSGVLRPLVPQQHRRAVFDAIHGLAHPGIRATRRLISSRFVWPALAADITTWCRQCQHCARAKVTRQHTSPAQPIAVPTTRFSHIHVDLVGPLPAAADGSTHLLTAVDRSTRWLEAFPLVSTSTEACLAALTSGWFSRFGLPAAITTDRGPQFASGAWQAAMRHLGIRHATTTAYHPQSNGVVERAHRRLKEALKAKLVDADWTAHLPWTLLGLRAAPREDCGVSTAELVYGSPLTLPAAVFSSEAPAIILSQQMSSFLPAVAPLPLPEPRQLPDELRAADFVYVRAPPNAPALSPAYRGPYRVLTRGDKFFTLQVGGRRDVVTVDRLKPHTGGTPDAAAAPPRRGRPPAAADEATPPAEP